MAGETEGGSWSLSLLLLWGLFKIYFIYLKSWVTGRTIETKRRQRVRHNFHLVHTPNAMARSGLKSGARGFFWASHVGTDAQELGLFVAFQSVLPRS